MMSPKQKGGPPAPRRMSVTDRCELVSVAVDISVGAIYGGMTRESGQAAV